MDTETAQQLDLAEYLLADQNITSLKDLAGHYLNKVVASDDQIVLYLTDEVYVKMYHQQDCCESVYVEDICGDLDDLVDAQIVFAEESTNNDYSSVNGDSITWTFYRFQTTKGSVDIRWCGTSNGYYSESVDVELVEDFSRRGGEVKVTSLT